MKINTDISYCEPHINEPICTTCKRNINLYPKYHGKQLWFITAKPRYIEGEQMCSSYLPLNEPRN